ncbi:N-acetyl-gamma-glutamyl-phosphate reductase [Roseibacterium sp. SDUM158017]|uniref:N-acetyl-gamma-glutamyl-phosphate reductase n=1 Tax=Roseicyclus salinarum TaxID=3036773 RepID=UPI0024157A24|nr:N-acetyl-gamma-glutamyl-phosphate reductase [Roseibacterium sp. SDUM158017]MDG4649039.1 N-acetyl-gamma-glutamyl-phosphate reductase [Roseibacterium sp. SDUM158017]
MTAKVFIDGEVGTTGLQIRGRLEGREDITLISLPEQSRKSRLARIGAFGEADIAILCLPDAAVHEIAPDLRHMPVRVIDASTAHRTDPDWAFGFAEMAPGQRARIAEAKCVSNPGCYSTGAIALIRPLVDAGLIAPDHPLTINAVSGYSGGGKSMIAEFESGAVSGGFVYATGQTHKHLPEIVTHARLARRPIFVPQVGQFAQGMIVQVPLHLAPGGPAAALAALGAHYEGARFVEVVERADLGERIDPQRLNGTNRMQLTVDGDAATGATVLIAVLDNLGKGASGAAVQNLDIMLGLDEGAGL